MLSTLALLLTLTTLALATETAVGLDAGSPLVAPSTLRMHKMHKMVKKDTDWSDLEHCPGGSIGDADACTFEPDVSASRDLLSRGLTSDLLADHLLDSSEAMEAIRSLVRQLWREQHRCDCTSTLLCSSSSFADSLPPLQTQTVTDSLEIGNSFTTSTSINVGFEVEGFSAGISQTFEQSW